MQIDDVDDCEILHDEQVEADSLDENLLVDHEGIIHEHDDDEQDEFDVIQIVLIICDDVDDNDYIECDEVEGDIEDADATDDEIELKRIVI